MSLQVQARRIAAALLVAGCLALPHTGLAQTVQPGTPEKGGGLSQTLIPAFKAATAQLEDQLKAGEFQLAVAAVKLGQAQSELDNLQVAVASIKAAMVLQRLPLLQVQELLDLYTGREKALQGELKDLSQETDNFKKSRQEQVAGQNALRVQLSIIQAKDAEAVTPELQQAFLAYLNLAGDRDRLLAQVLDQLDQRRRLLEQEKELIGGLTPRLKQLEETWKAQLLKRPAAAVPYREQVVQAWKSLVVIPQKGWDWLSGLVASGRLGTFTWRHLAPIIGLLGLIIMLGWYTRRLKDLVAQRFLAWKAQSEDHHLLPLYMMGQTLIANLFGLALIVWLGLLFWTLGLAGSVPAQLILAALGTLWVMHLTIRWVQAFFAGRAAGGVLTLDDDVARFYRQYLKLFLVYFFLGIFGLQNSALLDFPESSRLFLGHFFLTGVLVWGWWFLRRPYLIRLLPQLSEPTWLHRPVVSLFLRGLLVFLLAVIILADLLGFQILAMYVAQAAGWTFLAAITVWLMWLTGETIIFHLLHPEAGRVPQFYPDRVEVIQRIYTLSRWVLSLALGGTVVLWSLNFWGVPPHQVAWAFQWMTWGPSLGPVKLTTLSVAGVILVLYSGFFLSRLLRGLMLLRIFPHTALDTGVRYTISTTVHYVILVLAGLTALSILGFPLTNLILLFGALGVGIGFGLQNMVNNFLSGLILLFERPIKVGDLLVIDGQWGKVKEIRVRSTIFETFDRSVLIIPNSELVSNKVVNWTHYGKGINRLTLKVGVGYDSDLRQVTQLLTEVCRANPRVVAKPPPQISFSAYGESSLDFTIWVHLKTPGDRTPATHELNSAIFEAFNEHGIDIPFPQRDLHIKDWPKAPAPATES